MRFSPYRLPTVGASSTFPIRQAFEGACDAMDKFKLTFDLLAGSLSMDNLQGIARTHGMPAIGAALS